MMDYEPIELQAYYRSVGHLGIWEVLDKADIWRSVGIESVTWESCDDPRAAESALFDGRVDFVSGNHITPYALVAQGRPIVSIASPNNGLRERLVTREHVNDLSELRGKYIIHRMQEDRDAGFSHGVGNKMLYLRRAGVSLDDVEWITRDAVPEFQPFQIDALKSGRADGGFATGGTEVYEQMGLHVLQLPELPMIHGPTITTTLDALERKDRLGERLVKAMVMGIHYAKTHREETELILRGLGERIPAAARIRYDSVGRMPNKPYPSIAAVQNAHEVCVMKAPEAQEVSAMALWDLHYLRALDQSGFIDDLYAREPAVDS